MKNIDADLINKTPEEAESILNEEATKFRYDFVDDDNKILNDVSYDIERVTMTLRNGKVIATSRG